MKLDLVTASTDELADELCRRYDLFFMIAMRRDLETTEADEEVIVRSHGDAARLIGIIEREKTAIVIDQLDAAREVDE